MADTSVVAVTRGRHFHPKSLKMRSARLLLIYWQVLISKRSYYLKQLVLLCTSIQFLSMLLLTSQQTGMPFLVRAASRDSKFLATTTVVMMELMKISTCLFLIYINCRDFSGFCDKLLHDLWKNRWETTKVSVPAFVYALQNNLYYVALANIDATTYSVTYQLRILTTAILAFLILDKQFSLAQWAALLVSLGGVAAVQLDKVSGTDIVASSGNPVIGIFAAISMCWTSAFAGVYFEKMLKNPSAEIWVQNLRLSLMTLVFAFSTMVANDGSKIMEGGLFQGWTALVWSITIINSVGGLAVSFVMKYADNVKKTYCQTIAIGLTAMISIYLGERPLTTTLVLGVTAVVVSVYVYSFFPQPQKSYKSLPARCEEADIA